MDRTFDLYTVVPPGFDTEGLEMEQPVTGSADQIAAYLRSLGDLGFEEVRCDVHPKSLDAIEAMQPVVALAHEE